MTDKIIFETYQKKTEPKQFTFAHKYEGGEVPGACMEHEHAPWVKNPVIEEKLNVGDWLIATRDGFFAVLSEKDFNTLYRPYEA